MFFPPISELTVLTTQWHSLSTVRGTHTWPAGPFWAGSKRDAGAALALGPGENVTLVGESYSNNLPLQNAFRKQFGPTTDAFVTRVCDPWLGTYPSASLQFTRTLGAANVPESQKQEIFTGCTQPHDVEIGVDEPWLRLRYDGRTAPLPLTVEVDTAGLAAGEYKAQIRVKVPAALYPEITIPVTLTVEPRPAE